MKKRLIGLIALLLITVYSMGSVIPGSAVSAGEWQAGRIIDDSMFYNPGDMSVQQVQDFLNSKVPNCDTGGNQTSEYGGGTRAQYGTSRGYPPPYVCLKDYYENPNTHENNLQGRGIPSGGMSAAQIIHSAAQQYAINPKVFIVTLQKESVGPLVTDSWPFYSQYRTPMGYACPDTAPCDSQYFGFANQIYKAAWQFRRYADFPQNFRHQPYQVTSVRYNPSINCGSSDVYIHGKATAGLYNYTPYQPNQAALNNMYGSGDACSAHGNRNFWRIFNDWFGSPYLVNGNIILQQGLTTSHSGGTAQAGETVTASFQVKNTASFDIHAGGLGICGRINGQYYDIGFTNQNVIPAGGTITVTHSKVLDRPGTLQLFTCSYHASIGGWASSFYPYTNGPSLARNATIQVQDNPLITSVSFSPVIPAMGQPVTANIMIRNTSSSPVNIGTEVVAVRDPWGNNFDFPADASTIIPANSTITYSKTRTLTNPGIHTFFLANYRNGAWNSSYPSHHPSTVRQGILQVKENPLVTTGVSLSPAVPAAGQSVTATFSVRNESASPVNIGTMLVAARDPWGSNLDFPAEQNVTIAANTTYTYSQTRTFPSPGDHTFFTAHFNGSAWSNAWPKSADSSVARHRTVKFKDNPLITSGISLSPTTPTVGSPVTATVVIRNDSAAAVNIGMLVIAGRGPGGANVDFPADSNITIPANSTLTYSKTRTFSTAGTYSFFLSSFRNGVWDGNYPKSADSSVIRQLSRVIN